MEKKKAGTYRSLLIHPGETISDVLDNRGITQVELATRTGLTTAYISNVINGKKDISKNFAMALEYALGIKKSFWLNLQANYDSELLELNQEYTITNEEINVRNQLDEIVNYIREVKLIPIEDDRVRSILTLRTILKVSNLTNLSKCAKVGAFRISEKSTVNLFVLGAWIRICQIMGENVKIDKAFNIDNIALIINGLKKIMLENNDKFYEDIRNFLNDYGIDFYIMHNFKGAPVHGYVSKKIDGSYQINLTIRMSFADQFWFSLFHEIGHIVNGDINKDNKFVDYEMNSQLEINANKFAEDSLIDLNDYHNFINDGHFDINAIKRFADTQNVMPYIVIGRLRKDKYLKYNQFSSEMLRYKWK